MGLVLSVIMMGTTTTVCGDLIETLFSTGTSKCGSVVVWAAKSCIY